MNSKTDHPRDLPADPRDPPTRLRVEYEVSAAPPKYGGAATILVMMLVFVSAMAGYVGLNLLLHGDWRSALKMLGLTAMFLPVVPRMWRRRLVHVDPATGKDPAIEATESRAMLLTLERYDQLLAEARAADGAEDGGEPGPTSRPDEIKDERFYEPTDRGFEAKIAARMQERGDPG